MTLPELGFRGSCRASIRFAPTSSKKKSITALNASDKSYVKIYENHIKGLSCAGIFLFTLKKGYDIEYSEIEHIQIVRNPMYGDSISIRAHGERYGLILEEDADRVLEIIMSRMGK